MKHQLIRPDVSRNQLLATTVMAIVVYLVASNIVLPFDDRIAGLALISAVFHLVIFLFFDKIFPLHPVPYAFMSLFNYVLLGFFIHYTGGILSPFIFVFFFILISDSANANNFVSGFIASVVIYLAIIGGEYFGLIDPIFISTEEIYASPFGTALVAGSVVLFLTIVGEAYKTIIQGLRTSLQKELEQKERARQEMSKMDATSQLGLVVNKIVHDLRGPLGAIGGFINVIKRENSLTPQSDRDCEMMLRELHRITTILNRLIAYAKPGQMQRTRLCPVETLETVLSVISFYPGAQRVRFEREFAQREACCVYATREEVQQIFFNLLKNSVEALETSAARAIKCRVYPDLSDAVIEIADTGHGIPRDVLDTLWSGNVSTKKDGGGLGLSIVKEILDAYKGEIKILSEQGNGTRVVIRLPRYEEAL